ncbi:DUF305 domain-containing protein [Nocardia sp. BMG51109]|uniref:DUF305 domain-containing protein n=1 Tax=Nocardia sp. BMG51109 TaxID=1056816 RepID=UPI00046377F7|nr:DUF305 domain-containing protein [Nocardia sp. BMG51109]
MSDSRIRNTLAGTGIAVALLIAGCSNDDSGSSAPTSAAPATGMPGMDHGAPTAAPARTDFTDADVMFLQMMYPHHAQAIDMAKLVPGRSQNQQLIALAANVEKAQEPEMRQFADLLRSFGKPEPTTMGPNGAGPNGAGPDSMGHDTMGHGMPGMMSPDRMTMLENTTGAEFDRMWMQMMIDHHQGAIDMANTELTTGVNPEAQRLAREIVTAQQAEIRQMRDMLGQG